MTRIGITGTRYGMTPAQRERVLDLLQEHRPALFVHGQCSGVDVEVAAIADKMQPRPRIHSMPGPDGDPWQGCFSFNDEVAPPATHFARNRAIVRSVDLIIGCPRESTHQARGGTWYTIDFARKSGVPCIVVFPDGSTETGAEREPARSEIAPEP